MTYDRYLKKRRRGEPFMVLAMTVIAMGLATLPISGPATAQLAHDIKVNADDYKKQYGHWQTIELPIEFRLNAMHAATLPTGKILLVAGSGNNRDTFKSYANDGMIKVLKTAIYDPATGKVTMVDTPSDLFCGGHAHMHSGNLLVAGGTSGYELLKGSVKKPAGAMLLHNEDPDAEARTFRKGTIFTSQDGKKYASTTDVVLPPAEKMDHGGGNVMIHHSTAKVFVEAIAEDSSYVTGKMQQYSIEGLKGADKENMYGQGGPMTLNKQDFRGDDKTYEFDPFTEKYTRVGDMKESRWYPTLPVMDNGDVMAVSGLDITGQITTTTERYSPTKKQWTWGPDRAFPTYPALFRTKDPDVLFFSGSNAGYGPADIGRKPGYWNVKTNAFQSVEGLRDANIVETSGSVMIPPKKGSNDGSQGSRILVVGGGGVGESPLVTARTDMIDLAEQNPRYRPWLDLPQPLRYINLTVTPWDEIIASGGSKDYRAKGNSYSYNTFSIDFSNNRLNSLADETIGRSYHAGSLLLADGRVLVFGNDPLFSDRNNSTPGVFEQRLEIFTPPQFYRGTRPTLANTAPRTVQRGQALTFETNDADAIKTARMIPMNSTTHVTNIEQRSIGAIVTKQQDRIDISMPDDSYILPDGWYMLFAVNGDDIPSRAVMVRVNG